SITCRTPRSKRIDKKGSSHPHPVPHVLGYFLLARYQYIARYRRASHVVYSMFVLPAGFQPAEAVMRLFRRIALAVVALIIIALGILYFNLNRIIKHTIEVQSTDSLNLQTQLVSAR